MTKELDGQIAAVLAASPGGACQFAVNGRYSDVITAGSLQTVDDAGISIRKADRRPVEAATLFDLASLTKIVAALTLLTLVDDGALDLDASVGRHLRGFSGAKSHMTLRRLLTHTSGLPSTWSGWQMALGTRFSPDDFTAGAARAELLDDLLSTVPAHPPGQVFEYSCVGFNTAMALAERVTGRRWADLVQARALDPLGLARATFAPDPVHTAATERQPGLGRGVIRGIVHDETAWSLGGGCANAGLFASVGDVVRLGEAIRVPGPDRAGRAAEAMWPVEVPRGFDDETEVGPTGQPPYAHTLGLRVGQVAWMTGSGSAARGHTGFTGTSLHIDRENRLTVAILTNRIHPGRSRKATDPVHGIHALRHAITSAIYERV